MKVFISILVLSALMSCGPAPKLELRPLTATHSDKLLDGRINLDAKSVSDVLMIKYDNKVFLKCTLNVKVEDEIKEQVLSVNLVENPNCAKTMSSSVNGHKIDAEIQASNFTVYGKINHTDPMGTNYFMRHSPVADITVKWTHTDESGVILTGSVPLTLYENVPDLFVVEMTDKGVVKNFRCGLSANPVKEYQDEWMVKNVDDSEGQAPEVQ